MSLFRSTTAALIARNFWKLILGDARVSPANKQCIKGVEVAINALVEPVDAVSRSYSESFSSRPCQHPLKEPLFMQMGDYWIIRYQRQSAVLKTTRGLDYLAYLLRRPRREVHVTDLLGTHINYATLGLHGSSRAVSSNALTTRRRCALPILDSRAKAEYKRRIDELRKDAEEADRFNDPYRAARSRSEINIIAERLAAAVGLGGRDRRTSSEAERARSAVTKRIKEAIKRIADVIPLLGRHFAVRIKTGYFCSYSPHPDRPVAWKF